jgi:hypothetical protein
MNVYSLVIAHLFSTSENRFFVLRRLQSAES